MSKRISKVIAFVVIMAIVFIAVVVTCDNQYYLDLGYLMLLVAIASSSLESILLCVLVATPMICAGCAKKCEVEPIVEQNHKLIVPPNFGNMPK